MREWRFITKYFFGIEATSMLATTTTKKKLKEEERHEL